MKKNKWQIAGEKGVKIRWARRYRLLEQVSRYVSKTDLNWIQSKWSTKQIETLLKAWK